MRQYLGQLQKRLKYGLYINPRCENNENIHLRLFILRIRKGKRKKKTLFFNGKFLIEENG